MKLSFFGIWSPHDAILILILSLCVSPVFLTNVMCSGSQSSRAFKDICLYKGEGDTNIPIVEETVQCRDLKVDNDALKFEENGLRYDLCVKDSCPCKARNDGYFHPVQYTFTTPDNNKTTVIKNGVLKFYVSECITDVIGINAPPISSDPWAHTFILAPNTKYTLWAYLRPEVPVTIDMEGVVPYVAEMTQVPVTFRFMVYNEENKMILCADGKAVSKGCPLEDVIDGSCTLFSPFGLS